MSPLLLPLLALLVGCSSGEGAVELPDAALTAGAPVPVSTVRVQLESISTPVHATGTSRPIREADLAPLTSGRVHSIAVAEGQAVEAGQVLVQLDSNTARLSATQARASADAVRAQADQLTADYERMAPLGQSGSVTQSRIDQLRTQRDATQAQAAAASAAADAAARFVFDTTLRAPFAGTVVRVPLEVGEMAATSPPERLVRIVDLSTLEITIEVNERDLDQIHVGDAVDGRFPNLDRAFEGVVSQIGLEISPATRTAEVVVSVPNPEGLLRAGSFAELAIRTTQTRRGVVVPVDAVLGSGDSAAAFVVVDGHAARRPVKVRTAGDGLVEVVEGLSEGEVVVTTDVGRLRDGVPITLAEQVGVTP